MTKMTWPASFAFMFGGLLLCAYPEIMLPLLTGVGAVVVFRELLRARAAESARRAAVEARAAFEFQRAATLVAAPLPPPYRQPTSPWPAQRVQGSVRCVREARTVPLRRVRR